MNKGMHLQVWFVIAAIFGVILVQDLISQPSHMKTVPYSEFERDLQSGLISKVTVGSQYVTGTLKGSTPENPQHVIAARVDPGLAAWLDKYKVTFVGEVENTFVRSLLSWIVPAVLFFILWMYVVRNVAGGQGGVMSISKSKAKVYVEVNTRTSFADVAGVDEAKAELAEVVDFLKSPREHARLGARMPKGVLLVGPPGTGKTLLARAVAGEALVPFFSINGSEFVEMFVGVGAARVRDLFEQARQRAPAIVFIDELDALGRARGTNAFGSSHDEKEQTLNQLLSEMDGFDPQRGIVLLAATNRPEILDPALLRAGRFDRQVLVDRPDKIGRIEILKVHIRKVKLDPGIKVEAIAALTPGFCGADLANLVNEAALLATRRGADSVNLTDFTQAIERIVAGLEKNHRLLNPQERNVVAHHEMGHALVAISIPGADPVHKVSIIPRGVAALGYTIQRPTEDRYLMTREELEAKMAVLLGGRAAERIMFDSASTGAADDLAKATDIARNMITQFGMDEALGQVSYEAQHNGFLGPAPVPSMLERRYSESTAQRIDDAVRGLIDQAFERAVKILSEKKEILESAAQQLLSMETLTGEQIQQLIETGADTRAAPQVRNETNDGGGLSVAAASTFSAK